MLGVEPKTIGTHRSRILKKLGVRRLSDLLIYATHIGITISPQITACEIAMHCHRQLSHGVGNCRALTRVTRGNVER